jgi:hypothetical protein
MQPIKGVEAAWKQQDDLRHRQWLLDREIYENEYNAWEKAVRDGGTDLPPIEPKEPKYRQMPGPPRSRRPALAGLNSNRRFSTTHRFGRRLKCRFSPRGDPTKQNPSDRTSDNQIEHRGDAPLRHQVSQYFSRHDD